MHSARLRIIQIFQVDSSAISHREGNSLIRQGFDIFNERGRLNSMGIATDRGYAIIIRHRFAGVTVRFPRFKPRLHASALIHRNSGCLRRPPPLPILPGCSSARKLGLQPWGMHGVVRRCSRLPWRPIVTGHPSPLISPTFYPHAR